MKYWNFEPSVLIGTSLLMLGYALVTGPLRGRLKRSVPVPWTQQLIFYLGCMVMLVALIGPLDVIGDKDLFSAHMAQHMLLSFLVPMLWLFGTPGWLIENLIPSRLLSLLKNPFTAFFIFNGLMWTWHIPSLYDSALLHESLHTLEHLTFLSCGVIGFLPILKFDLGEDMTPLYRLIYLFPSLLSCTALAALITLASVQLYPFYGAAAQHWNFTVLQDQQLGGLAMWLPGDMLYLALIIWMFGILFQEKNLGVEDLHYE